MVGVGGGGWWYSQRLLSLNPTTVMVVLLLGLWLLLGCDNDQGRCTGLCSCSLEEEFMISGLKVYPTWIRSSGSKDWKFMIQEEKFMHYAPKIRSLCSKS